MIKQKERNSICMDGRYGSTHRAASVLMVLKLSGRDKEA